MCSCVIGIAKKVFCDLKSKHIEKDREFQPEIYSDFYGGGVPWFIEIFVFYTKKNLLRKETKI